MDQQITFGYWGVRGLGQVCRLLLQYTGANWVDKKYTSPDSWFGNDKKNMGFSFPNLPYIIEGNLKITESGALRRYIINRSEKKELLGKDMRDQAIVDNLLGVQEDAAKIIRELYFHENFEEAKAGVMQRAKRKLDLCQKFYGDK